MKRQKNLIQQIADIQNLHLAYYKAAKKKRLSKEVILFNENYEKNLEDLRKSLLSGTYTHGKYRQFTITDPKQRIISAAPFSDRIVHHAIMNVLEPIFERQFIYHTYACRKGKGTHSAARYALKMAQSSKCFLKLDMKKYFDTIDHGVLKSLLIRIIKDKKCLNLLFNIIDSFSNDGNKKGLPIGNLTSQFFANYYLSPLDHFVLEKLNPSGYVRYMDDIAVFASSRQELKRIFVQIEKFSREKLFLTLKTPVFGLCKDGLPFLGWRLCADGVGILQKTRRRMKKKVGEILNDYRFGRSCLEKTVDRLKCVEACRRLG